MVAFSRRGILVAVDGKINVCCVLVFTVCRAGGPLVGLGIFTTLATFANYNNTRILFSIYGALLTYILSGG